MGCAHQCVKNTTLGEIEHKLKECFCDDNHSKFLFALRMLETLHTNDFNINAYKVHCFYDFDLTIPSLCIIYGKLGYFRYIRKHFEVSLTRIDENLKDFKVSSLFLLCSKNYPEFLYYYLPLYMENYKKFVPIKSFTLCFEDFQVGKRISVNTPVQQACEGGFLNILNIIFEFFKDASSIPTELDIHGVNGSSGDNCALIACRECNYSMIKFLFNKCRCDYSVVNFKGESALQSACKGHQHKRSKNLLSICKFLIEEVSVDLAYNYKETLAFCEDKETYLYLMQKMLGLGLETKALEKKFVND